MGHLEDVLQNTIDRFAEILKPVERDESRLEGEEPQESET